MISEIKFANAFSSFWRDALPFGEPYVRQMNVNLKLFATQRPNLFPPNRYALVSEIGFRMFIRYQNTDIVMLLWEAPIIKVINEVSLEAWRYVHELRRNDINFSLPVEAELREGLEFANRLLRYFKPLIQGDSLIANPRFIGCGIVDACFGDIIAGGKLYEIKSVDRFFRLADIKQLLTYCALNSSTSTYAIDEICLLNPRFGRSYTSSIDSLAREISGKSSAELFFQIVDFMSMDHFSE